MKFFSYSFLLFMVDKKMVKTTNTCLKKEKYHFKKYSIRPIRKKDVQSIRKWRNE